MTEYIPKRGRGDRERQTSQGEFQRIAIDPLPRGGGAPNTPPFFSPKAQCGKGEGGLHREKWERQDLGQVTGLHQQDKAVTVGFIPVVPSPEPHCHGGRTSDGSQGRDMAQNTWQERLQRERSSEQGKPVEPRRASGGLRIRCKVGPWTGSCGGKGH